MIALCRRFYANVRMFPTLAVIATIVAVGEFSVTLLLVGLVTNTTTGLWAAGGLVVLEALFAFSIALVISSDERLNSRAQKLADAIVNYGTEKPVENDEYQDPDADGEYYEDEDRDEDEEERDEDEDRSL